MATDDREPRRWIPWLATALVVAATATGGALVFRQGSATRAADRVAFQRWDASAAPALARLQATVTEVKNLIPAARDATPSTRARVVARTTATRRSIERARKDLYDVRAPEVVQTTLNHYVNAIARELEAVAVIEETTYTKSRTRRAELATRARDALAQALTRFTLGDTGVRDARSRYDLQAPR